VTDMDCNEFVELVTEFLDGALDEESQARFVDHLSLCDGCTAYLDQIRETVRALDDLPAGDRLPGEARDRLLAAFRDRST
jgi:predicted anti-sigma-YlaC factor YlaD